MDNEISSEMPCPCGSGKPYGHCCKKKNFKFIAKNNEIIKQIPMHEEIVPLLQEQKKKFKYYYGREPSANDFVLSFEPVYGNDVLLNAIYCFRQSGIPERNIYAYYKSDGLLPCSINVDLLPETDIQEYNALCEEFDKAMASDGDHSFSAIKYVLLTNSMVEDITYHVICAVIDTLNDYIHRHNESKMTLEYQMATEKDYCLFSALKTIKTLQSIKQLIDAHLTECIYALGRGIFENYLYLCNINSDSSFFNELLLPKVDQENYSFARRPDGSINYKRVIKNETGEEKSVKVNIADLVERLPYDTDKELYQTFYITACQYVHVDVMSAQSYFSECDPYDELDRTLIASLIVGLLSVFLLLQIASNDTTLKQYKKDVNHLCHSELFPKISICLSAANCDQEHKNDIYDLLLRRISEEKSR